MHRAGPDLRSPFLRLAAIAALATPAVLGQGGGFTPGDFYLHTVSLPPSGGGLVRFSPYSGAAQVVLTYVAATFSNGIYCPLRWIAE